MSTHFVLLRREASKITNFSPCDVSGAASPHWWVNYMRPVSCDADSFFASATLHAQETCCFSKMGQGWSDSSVRSWYGHLLCSRSDDGSPFWGRGNRWRRSDYSVRISAVSSMSSLAGAGGRLVLPTNIVGGNIPPQIFRSLWSLFCPLRPLILVPLGSAWSSPMSSTLGLSFSSVLVTEPLYFYAGISYFEAVTL